ncbi:PREDICTED: uncharacterized protein LOC104740138 [Camelina sativa]|uniref:Uncharacterized protein LOC104740138 n=1 Tax=Camelina sativa TaxID=90675 RepID=A0ABM1QW57_CAMSA|nr:PREDICTED: uncharacterized protein LOC104740138 [Camelina sativa]
MMKPPTEEAAAAPITVYWDIKGCPVPDGYDPRRVDPCIKRYLRNLGYSGPITITAVGVLSEVPKDILEAVSTTGISLLTCAYDPTDMIDLSLDYFQLDPTPSNMMVISSLPDYVPPNFVNENGRGGYYDIFPFPFDSTPEAAEYLWKYSLLGLADPSVLVEEDNCNDTSGESVRWVCPACHDLLGQGFENFITHLSSPEHEHEVYIKKPSLPNLENGLTPVVRPFLKP